MRELGEGEKKGNRKKGNTDEVEYSGSKKGGGSVVDGE